MSEAVVKLTPEQLGRFVESWKYSAILQDMLKQAIKEIAALRAEESTILWDEAARLAGFESYQDAYLKGKELQIQRASGTITVKDISDERESA